jgi:autotransporter strand-loop-strand O-heptosyltransferase
MLKYNLNLINGMFFELLSTWENKEYLVKFMEKKDKEYIELYSTMLKKGMWAKHPRTYLAKYFIEIWDGEVLKEKISVLDHIKGKRVLISFESHSLGDTIAWVPYCLEFKNIYQCEVIVSTFKNFLFEAAYPELQFIDRGVVVENIVAQFEIGWYWDDTKEPVNPATVPLQQTATNTLNLPFKEIKPRIVFTPKERPLLQRYVAISTVSTAQCKHWYYWQELIEELRKLGYQVIEVSKDPTTLLNTVPIDDKSLENTMNIIHHAQLFIGLSSGLSWLSWAVGKKVAMISNFTNEEHEFQSNCIRIVNKDVCNSCWNNPLFKFDKGNWMWCPVNEDSPKHFECHKAISVEDVVNKIKESL